MQNPRRHEFMPQTLLGGINSRNCMYVMHMPNNTSNELCTWRSLIYHYIIIYAFIIFLVHEIINGILAEKEKFEYDVSCAILNILRLHKVMCCH